MFRARGYLLALKTRTLGPVSFSFPALLTALPIFYFQHFGEASLWLSSNLGFYGYYLSQLRGFQGSLTCFSCVWMRVFPAVWGRICALRPTLRRRRRASGAPLVMEVGVRTRVLFCKVDSFFSSQERKAFSCLSPALYASSCSSRV